MLGYGDSDAPRDVGAYALGAVARGLVALLDALGVRRAAVVGHDWGAAVAWRIAIDHPSRVARLVAVSVGHPACGAAVGGLEQRKRWWCEAIVCCGAGVEKGPPGTRWCGPFGCATSHTQNHAEPSPPQGTSS